MLGRETLEFQYDLERHLAAQVQRLLGEDSGLGIRAPGNLIEQVTVASSRAATHVGERVGGDVAAVVRRRRVGQRRRRRWHDQRRLW